MRPNKPADQGAPDVKSDATGLRFMDRGRVRGVPARDLTAEEVAALSPTLLGEMVRPGPNGTALYEAGAVVVESPGINPEPTVEEVE